MPINSKVPWLREWVSDRVTMTPNDLFWGLLSWNWSWWWRCEATILIKSPRKKVWCGRLMQPKSCSCSPLRLLEPHRQHPCQHYHKNWLCNFHNSLFTSDHPWLRIFLQPIAWVWYLFINGWLWQDWPWLPRKSVPGVPHSWNRDSCTAGLWVGVGPPLQALQFPRHQL